MTALTQDFINSCPQENGFRMRGLEMTRLEVFIDAAFAFSMTMLVISFDSMPQSYDELMVAIKSIPAFVMALAQLFWIWHTHNVWSRRFGLDTTYTVFISGVLLAVVLIYVYPMRIMAAGFFAWLTNGYLPATIKEINYDQLRVMFIFLGIGFVALCGVYVRMYRYAERLKDYLLLNDYELRETQNLAIKWNGAAVIGIVCVVLAIVLPSQLVPYSGFSFVLVIFWFPLVTFWRGEKSPDLEVG